MTHRPISAPRSARSMSCCLPANAVVWTWAVVALADRPTLLGTAFLAYVLGLRHAVDADHIAAIDNVVRKLMQEGKRPVSVGLFFSLGHSLVDRARGRGDRGNGVRAAGPASSASRSIGSIIGTGASAFFLLAIAADQSRHPARRLAEFPPRAPRRAGRRAGARSSALRPRLSRPHLPAAVPHGVAQLADVPDRLSVRARLRYRDRDHAVHRRRRARPPAA